METAELRSLAPKSGLVGGPFGSSLVNADYVQNGIPVVRGTNLNYGKYTGGDFVFVSEDKFSRDLQRNNARPGDLVFTQRGTIGQVALVSDAIDRDYVISQSQMRLRPDPSRADADYLYYACSSEPFLRQVFDHAIATGVPHINLGILGKLTVPLPDLSVQRAIAEVLGALDDKIAANTKLASSVDEYLSERLSELLSPSTEWTNLGSIASINSTSVKPVEGGSLRYVDIASVSVGGFDFPSIAEWATAPGRARRKLNQGDTLWSTVRPNRRSHALNLHDDPLLVASTGLAVLSPAKVGFAYLYEVTRLPQFSAYLETVAEGSAYPAVRAERFADAPVPRLSPEAIDSFEHVASGLRRTVSSAQSESRTLAEIRDTLLPQLMSGKLRVRDAERTVNEVL